LRAGRPTRPRSRCGAVRQAVLSACHAVRSVPGNGYVWQMRMERTAVIAARQARSERTVAGDSFQSSAAGRSGAGRPGGAPKWLRLGK